MITEEEIKEWHKESRNKALDDIRYMLNFHYSGKLKMTDRKLLQVLQSYYEYQEGIREI